MPFFQHVPYFLGFSKFSCVWELSRVKRPALAKLPRGWCGFQGEGPPLTALGRWAERSVVQPWEMFSFGGATPSIVRSLLVELGDRLEGQSMCKALLSLQPQHKIIFGGHFNSSQILKLHFFQSGLVWRKNRSCDPFEVLSTMLIVLQGLR